MEGVQTHMRATILIAGVVIVAGIAGAVGYLGTKEPLRADPGNPALVALGRTVYAEHCAACHGQNLQGQPNWRVSLPTGGVPAPPHDASGHTWHHTDQLLFDYTMKGGAALIPGDFKSNMPGFGEKLSEREIWASLAYIKSRWPMQIQQRQAKLNESSGRP